MNKSIQHIDDDALQLLIFGDEGNPAVDSAFAHVESCEVCLSRLQRIASDETLSNEAAELLSTYPVDVDYNLNAGQAAAESPLTVDFLSPPAHPEMLGRLGRYEIERIIGSGGMGVVLKGFDTELNRPVAVKVLARHLAHSGAARQRFAREARAAAAVVHEHVVSIHNVETEADDPFLVMQYVHGESLQARVDRDGPLDAKQILRIGIQAAAGLAAAHEQGVMHRDVKPANILLEHGVERVLLTDFGLARTVDDASLTHTGIVTGTPSYMSPEQASGESSDHRTDLFSLGAVIYFMATGHPPFRAERAMGVLHRICNERHRPIWEINPDIPDDVCDTIDQLLQKKPSRRIASASALREQLVGTLENLQHPRPLWMRRLRRTGVRHSKTIAGVLVLAVAIAAMLLRPATPDSVEVADNGTKASADTSYFSEPSPEPENNDAVSNDASENTEFLTVPRELAEVALDQSMAEIRTKLDLVVPLNQHHFDIPAADSFSDEITDLQSQLHELEVRTSRFEP